MIGSLTHAVPLQKSDDPELYRLVENVSIAAGLPATPPIYLIDDPAPNAFAAGSRPSTVYVGVTSGLRRLMPTRELEAVLAHEISHIRNRDVRLMTLAAVLVGVIAMISDFAFRMAFFSGRGSRDRNPIQLIAAIVALVLAPLAAVMLQMALSRRREFLADASAAAILNDPEAMALALRRLQLDPSEVVYADRATAHLFIESPTRSVRGPGRLPLRPLPDASPARGAHSGARGGRRLPARRAPHHRLAKPRGAATGRSSRSTCAGKRGRRRVRGAGGG